jgi:LPXTG-motif cell wall-anchored protein
MEPQNKQYKNFSPLEAKVQMDIPDRVYLNTYVTIVGAGLTVAAIVGGVWLIFRRKKT